MSPAQFDTVVQRVTALSRERPHTYRRRLIGLACLGYAYVLAVLLGLVLLGVLPPVLLHGHGGAALVKIELLVLGLMTVIVRAMWVTVRPAEGMVLRRAEVPALFDAVDRVRTAMTAPALSRILLTADLNAAVQQLPRFGIFGQRSDLFIGLPLLQVLAPAEFDAVLAHEFGHLSHRHGRFSPWIYRIRTGWNRLVAAMDDGERWLRFAFSAFVRWYAPLFGAYSFVQARAQEHEADRSAAESVDARTFASALVSVRVAAAFLEERYWPAIWSQVERTAAPPRDVFSAMAASLAAQLACPGAEAALTRALAEETTSADTHPCLRERLDALGAVAIRPEAPAETAVRLLGAEADRFACQLDADWCAAVAAEWAERHAALAQQRATLETLQHTSSDTRDVEDWWAFCRLTNALDGADAALPLCRQMVERFPDHQPARFALGALLLERDDADGLVHLEAGMQDDPAATVEGWEIAYAFLRRHGREAEAEALYQRAVAAEAELREVQQERQRIDGHTRYGPHDIRPEVVDRIRAVVAAHPEVARAYLVRKEVSRLPAKPLYVLGALRRRRWYRYERGKENAELAGCLADSLGGLPLQCYVVSRARDLRRIARVSGAQIHPPPTAAR